MKRLLLRNGLALLALGLSAFVSIAPAQQYPSRPIKFIVPVVPGGGVDIFARTIAIKLTEQLGVPVVVENRGGAAGVIGSEALVNSPPDGYTIMMGYSGHATNPLFVKKLPFDAATASGLPAVIDVKTAFGSLAELPWIPT